MTFKHFRGNVTTQNSLITWPSQQPSPHWQPRRWCPLKPNLCVPSHRASSRGHLACIKERVMNEWNNSSIICFNLYRIYFNKWIPATSSALPSAHYYYFPSVLLKVFYSNANTPCEGTLKLSINSENLKLQYQEIILLIFPRFYQNWRCP